MGSLIGQIFEAFKETIQGMTTGLKEALVNIIYVDPTAAEPVVSDLAMFIFLMFGLGLALAVVNKIFGLIRR